MYILKSVGVMSIAKLMGLLYGCLGLILALFLLMIVLLDPFRGQLRSPFAQPIHVVIALLMPVI